MLTRPKRVLHIVGAMKRAGVETWLMHALRCLDPRRVRLDFLVHTDITCPYDEEILGRGCRILRVCDPLYSAAYARTVTGLLRKCAFDAVHSHVHYFSGYLLLLARVAGTPLRIAHSHTDTSQSGPIPGCLRRCYLELMERLIRAAANSMVGASRAAGDSLFGAGWMEDGRGRVLPCGVDLSPFRALPGRSEARSEWGIGENELVIGHVGRFDPPKNHFFLIDIAAEVARRRPDVRVLLVGDGPLRDPVVERSRELGIGKNIILAGVRDDVPRLLAAMDVFLFPSRYEGLGLSFVEAQAAGLPCVISDAIPGEADVNHRLIHRLPLRDGPASWAEAILRARHSEMPRQRECLEALEGSRFDIRRSVEELYALYAA